VDGTLLDSHARISPRNRAVLREAVAAGLTLVLATGRTHVSLLRITEGLELPFHMITNGGAVGLDPGHAPRYLRYLDPELCPRIVEALLAEGLSPAVFAYRPSDPMQVLVASERGDPHFEAYVTRNRALVRVVPGLAETEIENAVEVAALGSGPHFDSASARVRERFAADSESHTMVLFIAAHYGKITEFFAPGVSKWHAFLGLFPEAVPHPESVIAVGDEANDHEMIEAAGLGIAMGNATSELKAVARHVTSDHDHDGLAEALEPVLAEIARTR
jgi:Cof subfamily protein (haloacid dehalogenase superfamily)